MLATEPMREKPWHAGASERRRLSVDEAHPPIPWPGPERRRPTRGQPVSPMISLDTASQADGLLGYGFGGAPICMIDDIENRGQPGDVVFFGLNHQLGRRFGHRNPGAASFVRNATAAMMPWTRQFGPVCHDIGTLSEARPGAAIKEAISISSYLAGIGRRPCLIGCDHTASLANIVGVAHAATEPLTYVYFDAHFDIGLHNNETELNNGNFIGALLHNDKIARVINIGARSWSTFDAVYDRVERFSAIRFTSVANVIERLADLGDGPIYVSLDADVLDPSYAPNLPCPEPFGLSSGDLLTICDWLGRNHRIAGADMCEIMPSDRSLCSEQVVMRSMMALFPKG